MILQQRSSYASLDREPITKEQLKAARRTLNRYWEDTVLVTHPNGYRIITIGNLDTILQLAQKGLENIQLTAFD